jgi:hypothetical protein
MNNYIWLFWSGAFMSTVLVEFISLRPPIRGYADNDKRLTWLIILSCQTIHFVTLFTYLAIERYFYKIVEEKSYYDLFKKCILSVYFLIHALTLYYYTFIDYRVLIDYIFFYTSLSIFILILILFVTKCIVDEEIPKSLILCVV